MSIPQDPQDSENDISTLFYIYGKHCMIGRSNNDGLVIYEKHKNRWDTLIGDEDVEFLGEGFITRNRGRDIYFCVEMENGEGTRILHLVNTDIPKTEDEVIDHDLNERLEYIRQNFETGL